MTGQTRARLDRAARLLDAPPTAPVPGQLALDRPPPSCDTGNPRCGATPARPYPCGHRCDKHAPGRSRPNPWPAS